jgi:hypothetical protein
VPRRRTSILLGTAGLGVALAAGAILARARGDDPNDPARRLPAIVLDADGLPTIGDENPTVGNEIPQGRTIATPTRSGLYLKIGDRIHLAVDHGSRVKLVSLRAGGVRVEAYAGSVRVRVQGLGAGEHFAAEVGGRSIETEDAVLLAADDRVTVLDGSVAINPGERDAAVVSSGQTWRPDGGAVMIDELDARRLAALVAGAPWVSPLGSAPVGDPPDRARAEPGAR